MRFILFYIVIFCLFLLPKIGQANYFRTHTQGWHWYKQQKTKPPLKSTTQDPVEELKTIKLNLHHALAEALLHPTPENMANYISLQNKISQQSTQFANQWQAVLLQHPELDYGLTHPTNYLAKQVEQNNQHQATEKIIQNFSKNNGLFFFYRSSCPYCRLFSPILKNFSEQYKMTVIPITTDGISLPEFPNSKIDIGQAKKFNVAYEPSLFAVNPYSHRVYPVSYGLLSSEELQKRILDLSTHFSGD